VHGHKDIMIVNHAKTIARDWVREEAADLPGFAGAFLHGSLAWLPDDAAFPPTSDVDIIVVLDTPEVPQKPGKLRYRDLLLDVSYLPKDQLRSPEQVLGQYHLAGSFRAPSVILDPSGWLTDLQTAVARDFAQRRWVRRRCEHARDRILTGYPLNAADPFPQQVIAWLFPAGITTHVLLTAGLRNPTVRQRYLAARDLLADYGHLEFYETLLDLLGAARMSQSRAAEHLAALEDPFAAAAAVVKSPFPFAADISQFARPIAIDGSRDLIARGDHREAIFWLAATWSRCQLVFHHDAPELRERFAPGYRALPADLGIASSADLQRRYDELIRALPQVWDVAETIMAANREIED
jgi:hypothetical protein